MCVLKYFLDIDCPGCGLTRSLLALLSGHFTESVLLHPMGVVVFLWLANFWWWRKISLSQTGRRVIGMTILAGFFVPWLMGVMVG